MKIKAVALRIIRQFFKDKRTLALIILAPIFILLLVSIILLEDSYAPTIAVNNVPNEIQSLLRDHGAFVTEYTSEAGHKALSLQEVDAFFEITQTGVVITLEGSNTTLSKGALSLIQMSLRNMNTPINEVNLKVTYLYGYENMSLFDQIGPILIGFLVFFFVFMISGVSFLRERTSGTLERLMATPIKRWELVVGYILGFGIFTTIQATIIAWFAVNVLGVMMIGQFLYLLLITFLLAMAALTLGILVSAYANNEFQVIQFIPIVIVPQFFFSGIFRIDALPLPVQLLSNIMPMKYGADALTNIMIRGKGWEAISNEVFILFAFSVVFMILNIFALKKHRQI